MSKRPHRFTAEQIIAAAKTVDQRLVAHDLIKQAWHMIEKQKAEPSSMAARNAEIKKLYGHGRSGETYASIGKRFGIAGGTVREIVIRGESQFDTRKRIYGRRLRQKDGGLDEQTGWYHFYCRSCNQDARQAAPVKQPWPIHCHECIQEGIIK